MGTSGSYGGPKWPASNDAVNNAASAGLPTPAAVAAAVRAFASDYAANRRMADGIGGSGSRIGSKGSGGGGGGGGGGDDDRPHARPQETSTRTDQTSRAISRGYTGPATTRRESDRHMESKAARSGRPTRRPPRRSS